MLSQAHAAQQYSLSGVRAAGRASGDRQAERGDHGRKRYLLLVFHPSGEVILRHVGDFVGDDASHLAGVPGQEDQAGIQSDDAGDAREGVDARVAHDEEMKASARAR